MTPTGGDDSSSRDGSAYGRSACTECQRRKQKCNREWPCNHCQRRKVADKCRFHYPQPTSDRSPSDSTLQRKRRLSREELPDADDDDPGDDEGEGFEALGYASTHLFASLDPGAEKKAKPRPKQYYRSPGDCPQLQRALQVLPSRSSLDKLVKNFIDTINTHYYMVYPPSFSQEYDSWWADRLENRPLAIQWTCLLLTTCSCSIQHADADPERKFERELGEPTEKLTQEYQKAAHELDSVIPVGRYHIFGVQRLMYSSFWFQSESRLIEGWHALSSAISQAQELGIHQEEATGPMPDFDREMGRRAWCVLNVWDWQMSPLLSRPLIIDRSECDVALPSLTLEGYSPVPLTHTKLMSQIVDKLAHRFGPPQNVVEPQDVQEYQRMVETWMRSFPPAYALEHPDTSMEAAHPWISLHRTYLHCKSYTMLMEPFRAHLSKPISRESPEVQLEIRRDGINYSLKMINGMYELFDSIFPKYASLNYALFFILDTAAVLCSAIMHDLDQSIPQRNEVFAAIDSALGMLNRLKEVTRTARTSYRILLRLSEKLSRPRAEEGARKRQQAPETSPTPSFDAQAPPAPERTTARGVSHDSSSASTASTHTLSASTATFYSTPPTNVVASAPPAMYPTTSAAPLAGHPAPVMEQPHGLSYAADESMLPAATMGPYSAADMGMMPTSFANVPTTTAGPDQFPDLYWMGIPDEQLAPLMPYWRYEALDLSFMPPQMPQDAPPGGHL